jgi:signal transduction histidine kinase
MAPTTRTQTAPDRTLLRGTLHKTSNSLCGIKGYASLLADPDRRQEDPARWARKILDEIARLEEIFRSVATLTPERVVPDVGVEVAPLVEDVARSVARAHPGLLCAVDGIPAGDLMLPAPDARLVLHEILKNSAEAAPRARVHVRGAVEKPGLVTIVVVDDAGGLEEGLAARAADPFVTTRDGHLGVGLTRVATLLEMYGLDWSLENNDHGGLTVRLDLAEATD